MPRLQVSAPDSSSAQAMPSAWPVYSMPTASAVMAMASRLPPPAPSSFSAISSMPAAFTPPSGMAAWAFTPVAVIFARPSPASSAFRSKRSCFAAMAASFSFSASRVRPFSPTRAVASAGTTLGRSPAYRLYTGMSAPASPPVTFDSRRFTPPFSMLITGNSASGEKP